MHRAACRHIKGWRKTRERCSRVWVALIVMFCVAIVAYGTAAASLVLLPETSNLMPPAIVIPVCTWVALGYVITLVVGNLEFARLIVDVSLPSTALKVVTFLQVVVSVIISASIPFTSHAAGRAWCAVLLGVQAMLLAASFTMRQTTRNRQQAKDACGLVGTASEILRSLNFNKTSSPMSAADLTDMLDEASSMLACDSSDQCTSPLDKFRVSQ